ncbi:MAG: hypothetical protein H6705_08260 [Myxococcales bacterium]|nr:hypothetical protein [Myxococcales bacterium]
MATTLDLAAEYDLSPDAIERWLREHGLGKPKGHLSSKAERAFRDAHDKHRSVAQWFVTPHRQSAPLTSPAHNPATNPATRVDNPAITNHYKHKHDQLLDGYRGVVAERDAARAARSRRSAPRSRASPPPSKRPKPAPSASACPPPSPRPLRPPPSRCGGARSHRAVRRRAAPRAPGVRRR